MVSDFKKATRQLSGGWRNNNPPMDFYQNSSQREVSFFGNDNRPPVTTLLATASYPELSYQHLHEETAKLSKSIFDASKVTVVEDEVEVDIFDVEDDDSTDTEVETQNDIKEENEKNSKASSCIQSAVSSVISVTEPDFAETRKGSSKSSKSRILAKLDVDPIIRCHTTQTSYLSSSSSYRRPELVMRPKTTSVRWRTKSAFSCNKMPEKPQILKQYEDYNAVNKIVGKNSSMSQIPVTEYEKGF
ncbi:unnamed protein product [Oikopleura dioica]|uniref:Uncharacterized protein n=1 Tax=Oikopleura dioica TaxID=34765 RepID=E4WSM6_OIKDI|nr:unnamed protein product [Oikopleura dioica]